MVAILHVCVYYIHILSHACCTNLTVRPMTTQIILEVATGHELHNDEGRLALGHDTPQAYDMVASEVSVHHTQQYFSSRTVGYRTALSIPVHNSNILHD